MHRVFVFLLSVRLFAWNVSADKLYEVPDWMEDQISTELQQFAKGINKEDVKFSYDLITAALWGNRASLAYVKHCNGQFHHEMPPKINSIFQKKALIFIEALEYLHSINPLPEFEMLISLDDCCDSPLYLHQTRVPIFTVSKRANNHKVLLMPPGVFFPEREAHFSEIIEQSDELPWKGRNNQIFWRFNTFNRPDIDFDWRLGPTLPLLYLPKREMGTFDFAISSDSYRHIGRRAQLIAKNGDFTIDESSLEKQLQYRYLLSFDQRAIPRDFEEQLMMGSLLIIPETTYSTWITSLFKGSQHYVPLDGKCRNLMQTYDWCETHTEECLEMVENAKALAENVLPDQQVFIYFNHLLHKYLSALK